MTILLLDDHVLVREALRGVLKELNEDATVLDAAEQPTKFNLVIKL
jgi:DNA-binding NarL/FixJ family response regulator